MKTKLEGVFRRKHTVIYARLLQSPLFMYFVIVQPARRSWRPFIPSQHRHEFYHRREFFPFEKFAQPCSHRRMMELGYGVWGHSLAYKGKQGTREFSGSKLNFNLARYATSDQVWLLTLTGLLQRHLVGWKYPLRMGVAKVTLKVQERGVDSGQLGDLD